MGYHHKYLMPVQLDISLGSDKRRCRFHMTFYLVDRIDGHDEKDDEQARNIRGGMYRSSVQLSLHAMVAETWAALVATMHVKIEAICRSQDLTF